MRTTFLSLFTLFFLSTFTAADKPADKPAETPEKSFEIVLQAYNSPPVAASSFKENNVSTICIGHGQKHPTKDQVMTAARMLKELYTRENVQHTSYCSQNNDPPFADQDIACTDHTAMLEDRPQARIQLCGKKHVKVKCTTVAWAAEHIAKTCEASEYGSGQYLIGNANDAMVMVDLYSQEDDEPAQLADG